jgi:hypothetical protein
LPYLLNGVHSILIRAQADSVAGVLSGLAERLSRRFPWQPDAAAAFVLTGAVPEVLPLAASVRFSAVSGLPPLAEITLRVEPWVPATTVTDFYTQLRRRMHRPRGRPPSEIGAAIVRFVLAERRASPGITWRELAERWSLEHPERPEDDYRHFRQAFTRAQRALLYPGYRPYSEEKRP